MVGPASSAESDKNSKDLSAVAPEEAGLANMRAVMNLHVTEKEIPGAIGRIFGQKIITRSQKNTNQDEIWVTDWASSGKRANRKSQAWNRGF